MSVGASRKAKSSSDFLRVTALADKISARPGKPFDEQFTVRGVRSISQMSRKVYEEYQSALKDRLAKGRYTLEDAAMHIEATTNERADEMLQKLEAAAWAGKLVVYEPGKNAKYIYGPGGANHVRIDYEEAYANDLNTWLAENELRIACEFPESRRIGS